MSRVYPDGTVSTTAGGTAGGVGPNGQAFTRVGGWHNTGPVITPPAGAVTRNPRGGKWGNLPRAGSNIEYPTGRQCRQNG